MDHHSVVTLPSSYYVLETRRPEQRASSFKPGITGQHTPHRQPIPQVLTPSTQEPLNEGKNHIFSLQDGNGAAL